MQMLKVEPSLSGPYTLRRQGKFKLHRFKNIKNYNLWLLRLLDATQSINQSRLVAWICSI